MIEVFVFVLVSVGLLALSLRSLRDPRAHGFPRFFAFECLAVLVLMHVRHWFEHPLAAHQLVSWVLLAASTLLALHGFWLLQRIGRPHPAHGKASDIGIERTSALVTVGAYRWIRHPLYASGVLGAWGVFFKAPSLVGGALAVATTLLLGATARLEEAENLEKFGAAYADYARATWRFIPFVY